MKATRASIALALWSSGCFVFSPFGVDPPTTDLTAKNLARIEAQQPPPNPFRIVVIGDTHDAYDATAQAVDAINALPDIEFVLHMGDITDRGLQHEFNWTWEELDRLNVPYLTVIGNHDAIGNGTAIYREMFGPLDYSFRYGGFKFVGFNSNILEFPESVPNRQYLSTTLSDLAPGEQAILFTHQPIYTEPELPGSDAQEFYRTLLLEHDVELVLHGHLNDYALYSQEGVTSLQASTFEKEFYFSIVTLSDKGVVAIERCRYEVCEPLELPEAT